MAGFEARRIPDQGRLAQSAEYRSHMPEVTGSSPVSTTDFNEPRGQTPYRVLLIAEWS
jgi:hypothetical protein